MVGRTRAAILGISILILAGCCAAWAQSTGNASPVAQFRAHAVNQQGDATVLFDATGSKDPDGRIIAYQWVFGDGTTGSGARLKHTYPNVGLYDVTLLVRDDGGSSHMIRERIDVSKLPADEGETAGPVAAPPELPGATAPKPATGPEGTKVGDRAPSFSLPDFDGEIVRLSDYLGRVVAVEFFFSTCSGCISSIPRLVELRQTFGDEGLVVIVVVLDRNPASARSYFSDTAYDDLIVLREADPSRPTRAAYGVSGVPHVFLIDRAGIIRYTGRPGYLTDDTIRKWL